jgi:hypothetical protein
MNDVGVAFRKLEAGMQSARRPQYIAMSFHRLFLGGLLPSRARLRFTGRADNTAPDQVGQFLSADSPANTIFRLTTPARIQG